MLRRILPTVLLVFAVIPLLGQTTPEQRLQNEVKQSPFHALVIGIGDYKFLPKLVTATNDATTIAAVLRKQYGFKVKLLLNSSREQVLDGLDECRSLPENSSLVIYFAGHTISDRDMERAYWLPVDAAPNHRAQWILTDEVIAMIRASRARHIVVFTDTPFSSEPMLRSGDGFGADKLSVEYLTTVWHRRSRSFLSGYNRDERVPDGPGKLSAFASAVLDGLTTIDKQLFTVAELFNRIVE